MTRKVGVLVLVLLAPVTVLGSSPGGIEGIGRLVQGGA